MLAGFFFSAKNLFQTNLPIRQFRSLAGNGTEPQTHD